MNSIAVIIPCYNGWKYMNMCLKSLEEQTVKPDQVIIVDDCSNDDSYIKLLEYQKQSKLNILLLKNETNSGPSISRRNAVMNLQTDYVAFCDCDDWYETDFIERSKKQIELNGADLVLFDNYEVYKGQKKPADTIKPLINKSKKELIATCRMSLCRMIVKKDCIENVEFPALYYSEDGVVLLQILDNVEKISFCDMPLYNYYFREDSASKKLSIRAYDDSVEAFKIIEKKFLKKYSKECEFLGIKYLLYGAVINGIKSKISYRKIKKEVLAFFKKYPQWYNNEYIYYLGKGKRLYLKVLRARLFFLFPIMAKLHTIVVRIRVKK